MIRAQHPRVAVDALGGDHAPGTIIEGAVAASRELGVEVLLVGPREQLLAELTGHRAEDLPIQVIDARESVAMGERVTRATLKKRSSIQIAIETLRDGRADAFFSAGNTAACWTIAKLSLGALEQVDRPALAAVVPRPDGRTVLLDVGANASCKARHLEQFAVMGDLYTRAVYHMESPRVGLMSLGEEESKGNDLTKEVHEALKGADLNFIGNVEGRDLFTGRVDVIVMDGFTGNAVLKACEELGSSIIHLLREELGRTPLSKLGALLSWGAFRRVRRRLDASEYGGAPLLGIRGCCVIGHGRSNASAVKHGVRVAAEFFSSNVNARIEGALGSLMSDKAVAAGNLG